jgi:hypothetical protein
LAPLNPKVLHQQNNLNYKDNKMKQLIALVLVVFVGTAYAEAEVKKVCHDVNGKQVCKNVKVHKKVEGTKVPEKAPAKPDQKKK